MMARLSHRGVDGQDVWAQGGLALGYQRFWTTPEELGGREPLRDEQADVTSLFEGRLDNREQVLEALGLAGPEGRHLSDAAIVLRAYLRWGERLCEHLLGPFALALYDARSRSLLLGRDALGDRTLFYNLTPRLLVAASEEGAVLAHPAVSDALNEATLASYLAVRDPAPGSTFYAQVRELLPAHCLRVDPQGERLWRYWAPEPGRRLSYRSDEAYGEHLREVLTLAVACRLRSSSPPAVMMSGGLDSTSVAAVAAQHLAQSGRERLRTISFVFDELALCDERSYIDAVNRQYASEAMHLLADDAWPLSGGRPSGPPLDRPDGSPYRRLKERVYDRTRAGGSRVLLSGGFSDHMYSGAEEWLADLCTEGRWAEAGREFLRYLRHRGVRATLASETLRHVLRRWLRPLGLVGREASRKDQAPIWLTPYAAGMMAQGQGRLEVGAGARRPAQAESLLGLRAASSVTGELVYASHAGVELRYPYRDRRLVEFMLSVPADQLFNRGLYKYILRNAMRKALPESITRRERATSLVPLFVRGIYERELGTVERLLGAPGARWPDYVRSEWIANLLSTGRQAPHRVSDGIAQVVLWRCISLELWQQGLASGGA